MAVRKDVENIQGDRWEYGFQVVDEEGNPFDITGWVFYGEVRHYRSTNIELAVMEFSIQQPPDGSPDPPTVIAILPEQESLKLKEGTYFWDLKRRDSLGYPFTYLYGMWRSIGRVSNAE